MYAAIGDDGLNPVVWGVGETDEAALADAREWLEREAVSSELILRQVTPEEAAAVVAGDCLGPAIAALVREPARHWERDRMGWR